MLLFFIDFKRQIGNTMFFYLSIGTNITPKKNAVKIIRAILDRFGDITLFPFVKTKPVGMKNASDFLNSLSIITTQLPPAEVKKCLNTIEINLGRDRSDPNRSKKDRVADIDILLYSNKHHLSLFNSFNDAYVQACLIGKHTPEDLSEFGLPSFQRASTIHIDNASGQILIVEDKQDGLVYR